MGAAHPEGMEEPNLTDAGDIFISAVPDDVAINGAVSFGMIRGATWIT